MTIEKISEVLKDECTHTLESLRKDLAKLRTGRASIAMLDGIKVNYYGNLSPLNQVANLSVPEPRQIVIQPFDVTSMGEIEKAIMASDLGLTPMNQGRIIRINIPELTEERRKDLAKIVRKRTEEAKVAIRQHRHKAIDGLKGLEKAKTITEDDNKKGTKKVQDAIDDYIKKSDEVAAAKEKEILEF